MTNETAQDYDDGVDDDFCDHEDAEMDIFTGRIVCSCGWTHWTTTEEYLRRVQRESEAYDAFLAEMEKEHA